MNQMLSVNGVGRQGLDRWFRYPAGFSAATLDMCFQAVGVTESQLVVDPFAGVGTTGVHAVKRRISFAGIEVHPLIAELAALKFQGVNTHKSLPESARRVISIMQPASLEHEHSLIRRSFSDEMLCELVSLRDAICSMADNPWTSHLKWCLLGILRDCASIRATWPYQRPDLYRAPRVKDPIEAFLRRVDWMQDDLNGRDGFANCSHVVNGDSRDPAAWQTALGDHLADAIVCSPPYLNNFDYADATRLELYFWGTAKSWLEMTSKVRAKMITATTQQSKSTVAAASMKALSVRSPETFEWIRGLSDQLSTERKLRRAGKLYDQVLPSYFEDIHSILSNIASWLQLRGRVALVVGDSAPYGVFVDTPGIIAKIANEIGFETLRIQEIRPRGMKWAANSMRHKVALSEKLVLLQAPRGF